MPRTKIFLCCGICFFYITVLTAQVISPKNKRINSVASYQVYPEKLWSMQQLPKHSTLYRYNSKYMFDPNLFSVIGIDLWHTFPPLSISNRLQLHLKKNLLEPYTYLLVSTSCWDPDVFNRHETSVINNTFFKYQ